MTTQNQEPIAYSSQQPPTRPGWRTCCRTRTTSLRSGPSTGPASGLPESTARCSQRDHVRQSQERQIECFMKSKGLISTSSTAPPEPPRMWRYVSWTGKWLYVWWDHIQYDWFGNISFPLYYKVSVLRHLLLKTRMDELKLSFLVRRSCSEKQATTTGRSTSPVGTLWTSPCLRLETLS